MTDQTTWQTLTARLRCEADQPCHAKPSCLMADGRRFCPGHASLAEQPIAWQYGTGGAIPIEFLVGGRLSES